ncbi:MAG: intracellular sulfur oxidation DsrE/DsrF family protein [Spirosomataceae bacterium]|jgi:intracellular sulfur oxidation DsrE/DsrF family protein
MKYLLVLLLLPFSTFSQERHHPLVPKYGAIFDTPFAVSIVDTSITYKVVIDVTEAPQDPITEVNQIYDRVAKLMNLHAEAGVKEANMNFVCVIHYKATTSVLSDEGFMKEFGKNNPNTEVIQLLADHGVKFYVCGQSLIARKIIDLPLNPNIKPIHGAILGLSHFQNLGYALMN